MDGLKQMESLQLSRKDELLKKLADTEAENAVSLIETTNSFCLSNIHPFCVVSFFVSEIICFLSFYSILLLNFKRKTERLIDLPSS